MQVKKDFRELVVSARQDEFYRKHMYSNFGDIGMAVKTLVDDFQKHNSSRQNVSTLEDMQNFVENYSDFSAAQRNASKHVTLISTLSSIVDSRSLMQVLLPGFSRHAISPPKVDKWGWTRLLNQFPILLRHWTASFSCLLILTKNDNGTICICRSPAQSKRCRVVGAALRVTMK